MFDQRSNAVFTQFVAERSRVVTAISCETPQVARRNAGDLRANLYVMLLRGRRVNVGDVQRFDVLLTAVLELAATICDQINAE